MTEKPPYVPKNDQPCFLVTCMDNPANSHLRADHLEGHLIHVENNWQQYVTAGPIRNPGEDALVGSVFLVLANTLEDARALMKDDPYVSSDLYASVDYKEMTMSIGLFIGGKIWSDKESIVHRALGGPTDDPASGLNPE